MIMATANCSSSSDGSSSGSSDGLSVEASVSQPSTNVSALKLPSGVRGLMMQAAVTEASAEGIVVHAEDTAGTEIGTPCTTDSTGTCDVTGLTSAQLEAGIVLVAEDAEGVPIHAYQEYEAADVTAAEASGDALAAPVNTETDAAYGVLEYFCNDDLANCTGSEDSLTVNRDCIVQATSALMGDDDPSTDDLGGYAEALYEAHANAIAGATAGANPADLMREALGGDPTGFTGTAGTTVGDDDIPVEDSIENFVIMMDTIRDSFCAAAAGAETTYETTHTEAGTEFDPAAMVGMFRYFTPDEIGEYEVEDFRGFAGALPALDGGFRIFDHPEARRTAVNMFRNGGFADPTKAGAALGFMGATFPPPAIAGDWENIPWGGTFDYEASARAAALGWLEMGDDAATFDPSTIRDKFNTTFSDAGHRQAILVGGSSAIGDFIGGFVNDPNNFVPANHLGEIKAPPGGACEDDDDCLPCDNCSNDVCTSLSTTMGSSCTDDDNCESVTTCVGGFISSFGGHCMCTAGVPTGAPVGGGAGFFGVTDGFGPPADGGEGAPCGTDLPACNGGRQCSGQDHGVCIGGTFKKGPFAPCTADAECFSDDCSDSGICTADGDIAGTKAVGQGCSGPAECSTFFCQAGLCAIPDHINDDHALGTNDKKADGESCITPFECASFVCAGSPLTCQPGGGGQGQPPVPPSNLPTGAFCIDDDECLSGNCGFNPNTHQNSCE